MTWNFKFNHVQSCFGACHCFLSLNHFIALTVIITKQLQEAAQSPRRNPKKSTVAYKFTKQLCPGTHVWQSGCGRLDIDYRLTINHKNKRAMVQPLSMAGTWKPIDFNSPFTELEFSISNLTQRFIMHNRAATTTIDYQLKTISYSYNTTLRQYEIYINCDVKWCYMLHVWKSICVVISNASIIWYDLRYLKIKPEPEILKTTSSGTNWCVH